MFNVLFLGSLIAISIYGQKKYGVKHTKYSKHMMKKMKKKEKESVTDKSIKKSTA